MGPANGSWGRDRIQANDSLAVPAAAKVAPLCPSQAHNDFGSARPSRSEYTNVDFREIRYFALIPYIQVSAALSRHSRLSQWQSRTTL
jgi:hypothetical protein